MTIRIYINKRHYSSNYESYIRLAWNLAKYYSLEFSTGTSLEKIINHARNLIQLTNSYQGGIKKLSINIVQSSLSTNPRLHQIFIDFYTTPVRYDIKSFYIAPNHYLISHYRPL